MLGILVQYSTCYCRAQSFTTASNALTIMGTLNESVTTELQALEVERIFWSTEKESSSLEFVFVKLSLLLTAFLVVRISVRKFNSSRLRRLCPSPPSPHCLINFCRWQKLTQICVYQEIINISSLKFSCLGYCFALLVICVNIPALTGVWMRGYFVRLWPAAGQTVDTAQWET